MVEESSAFLGVNMVISSAARLELITTVVDVTNGHYHLLSDISDYYEKTDNLITDGELNSRSLWVRFSSFLCKHDPCSKRIVNVVFMLIASGVHLFPTRWLMLTQTCCINSYLHALSS